MSKKTTGGILLGISIVLALVALYIDSKNTTNTKNTKNTYITYIKVIITLGAIGCFFAGLGFLLTPASLCDPPCSGDKPVCNDGTCVKCDKANVCPNNILCKSDGTCVKCDGVNNKCPVDAPVCNQSSGVCLECDDTNNCPNNLICKNNRCVKCSQDIKCPVDKPICNNGGCLECDDKHNCPNNLTCKNNKCVPNI